MVGALVVAGDASTSDREKLGRVLKSFEFQRIA
jgi:hypothetical protein